MRWPSSRALVLGVAVVLELVAAAAADDGTFFNPPGNVDYQPVWTLGETQVVTWNSTFPACDVGYQASDSSYANFFATNLTSNTANWTVTIANSGSQNNTAYYYLIVQNSYNNSQYFYSTEVDFVAPLPSQGSTTTTTVSSTGTAVTTVPTAHPSAFKTATQTAISSPTSTSASTSTDNPTSTPTPTPGLGGGAIAGIVIGSLAGLSLLAALAFLLLVPRKRRKASQWLSSRAAPILGRDPRSGDGAAGNDEKRPAELSPNGQHSPTANASASPVEMQASIPVHELLGSQTGDAPHELDASEAGDLEEDSAAAAMLGATAAGSSRRVSRLASEGGEQRSVRSPVSPRTEGARSPNSTETSGLINSPARGSDVVGDGREGLGWG